MLAKNQLPPTPLVNSLASRLIDLQGTPSMDTLASGEVGRALLQFYTNEAATISDVAARKPSAAPTPTPTPAVEPDVESMALYPTGGDLTAERANLILIDIHANDVVTDLCHACARNQANIAGAVYCQIHYCPCERLVKRLG